jgi:hypothetical protein
MMRANVVSKYKGNSFRTVEVPEEELNEDTTLEDKLDLIYRYGQNEFQPRDYPSVSSGDLIFIDGKFHIIESFGFKEISEPLFNELREKYQKMEAELKLGSIYQEINLIYKENDINAR